MKHPNLQTVISSGTESMQEGWTVRPHLGEGVGAGAGEEEGAVEEAGTEAGEGK